MAETNTTYIPPAILSDMDDRSIHARMMDDLPMDIDKTEGGFAWDFTEPAAIEKAGMMIAMNEVVQLAFPAWSYGVWLDQIATSSGISRRAPNRASGQIKLTGIPGTKIPLGYQFATPSALGEPNILFETTEHRVIGEDGTATISIQATDSGTSGNVPANAIALMLSPISGIEHVLNPAAITGGTDQESDESLRQRIRERDLNYDASFVGNVADYKRWAQEVPAVGSVTVIPEWQGIGTGTVKLVAMDSNGQPANETILTAIYNHIMAPSDEDQRLAPVGAILTVTTATELPVSVSAGVKLLGNGNIELIIPVFTASLAAYFSEAKADGVIRYTRIGSVLSGTAGVADYENLLVNGGTANILVDDEHYPHVDQIELAVIE